MVDIVAFKKFLEFSDRKIKVLVIDDEPHIAKLVKYSLDSNRFEVYEAYTGSEGINVAKNIFPDIIISDIMMPKVSGYDVCKELKRNPLTSHIPIIMMSARCKLSDKMHSVETDADDYLCKPFDPQELMNKVVLNLNESATVTS